MRALFGVLTLLLIIAPETAFAQNRPANGGQVGANIMSDLLAAAAAGGSSTAPAASGLVFSEFLLDGPDAATPVIFFTEEAALLDASKTKIPTAVDLAGERKASVTVNFDPLVEIRRTSKRVEWSSQARVVGMLPASTLRRSGRLYIGDEASTTFTYVVTNKRTFTWNLNPPAPNAVLPQNEKIKFSVTTTDEAGTNLRICNVSLSGEHGRSVQLPAGAVGLCIPNSSSNTISPGEPTPVVMTFAPEQIPYGTYSGTITLALSPSAETKQITLAISNSSNWIKLAGAGLLLLGIALSVTALKARVNVTRAEAMLPFAYVRGSLKKVREQLTACIFAESPSPDNTLRAFAALESELSVESLDVRGVLPKLWPSSSAPVPPAVHLQYLTEELARLKRLVTAGLCPVYERRASTSTPEEVDAIEHVLANLDQIANVFPATLDELQREINKYLALLPERHRNEFAKRGGEAETDRLSSERLLYRAQTAGNLLWVIWMIVTVVTGIVATILRVPGFGTPMDLVTCFLWGFGVNAIGTQLQQLTPASVGNVVGIALPKI